MKIDPLRLANDLAKIALVALLLTAPALARATAKGVDFLPFWAAGKLVLAHHAGGAYDLSLLKGVEAGSGASLVYPFLNPPPFLLLIAPFAALPYQGALLAFDAVCLAVYLTAAWPLLKGGRFLLAAFPPVALNLIIGQNGLLFAGLFVWTIRLLDRWPIAAGMVLGLMTVKPQLGLLFPVALLAGGRFRTILAAGLTTVAIYGAAELSMPGATAAFLSASGYTASLVDNPLLLAKLHSVLGALRLAGVPMWVAVGAQALVALAAAVLVWRVWRAPGETLRKGAVLAAATPLATPYVFDYDFAILILPLALSARAFPIGSAFAYVAPGLTRIAALTFGVGFGPIVAALTLFQAVRLGPSGVTETGSVCQTDPVPSKRQR